MGNEETKERLTIANIRRPISATLIILQSHLLTAANEVLVAFRLGELVRATAPIPFFICHLPLLQASEGQVLPEEHVEGRIDVVDHVVAEEDDAIEAVEDHTYFEAGVPFVVAALRNG